MKQRVFSLRFPLFLLLLSLFSAEAREPDGRRPNILFCIADDWGWPHAGAYGNDNVLKTPAFDRIAREGVLFKQAYVPSPSCTPCRNALMTGQWHWKLGAGANLNGTLPQDVETFSRLLQQNGYHVGSWRKSFGPGKLEGKFLEDHPAGKPYGGGFSHFLKARKDQAPFCFWLGAYDPHRGYEPGRWKTEGMDPSQIQLFPHFPDNKTVREDVADYYFEVQRFDSDVAAALKRLEEIGELQQTIIVITGDHGMPFPRCKSNLYDCGTRVPLALRWGSEIEPGQVLENFVSLIDLAPTFLAAAGVQIPSEMDGHNLLPALRTWGDARLRPFILTGKERHVPSQTRPSWAGYPSRAYRDHRYLYIRNYAPDRWPNGSPAWQDTTFPGTWYGDTDNGPTKTDIIRNQHSSPQYRQFYQWSFGKRPAEELYDLAVDPHQLHNVASQQPEQLRFYRHALTYYLEDEGDPRHHRVGFDFDNQPYHGGGPKHPDYKRPER